jgi:hypothetical protein
MLKGSVSIILSVLRARTHPDRDASVQLSSNDTNVPIVGPSDTHRAFRNIENEILEETLPPSRKKPQALSTLQERKSLLKSLGTSRSCPVAVDTVSNIQPNAFAPSLVPTNASAASIENVHETLICEKRLMRSFRRESSSLLSFVAEVDHLRAKPEELDRPSKVPLIGRRSSATVLLSRLVTAEKVLEEARDDQNLLIQAAEAFSRSIAAIEQELGPNNPETICALISLAEVYPRYCL